MKKTKWILISEKEPEEYREVLVTISNEVFLGWNVNGKTWYIVGADTVTGDDLVNTNEIKAWRPLPKPYKERR